MTRLAIPVLDDLPEESRTVLDSIHAQLGMVPNVFRLLGSNPAVLQGFTAFSKAVGAVLNIKISERIALAVAQANGCDYSLSEHRYIALNIARICPEEIELNRKARSAYPKADAAVKFAAAVLSANGSVTDDDIAGVREAGFDDPTIVAIIAVVALNNLTSLLNSVAQTEIDFPVLACTDLDCDRP